MPEHERRDASRKLASAPTWPTVYADLIGFAQSAQDPAVRCGRLDVLAYLQESIIGTSEDED